MPKIKGFNVKFQRAIFIGIFEVEVFSEGFHFLVDVILQRPQLRLDVILGHLPIQLIDFLLPELHHPIYFGRRVCNALLYGKLQLELSLLSGAIDRL
ncbi:hypothetical protein D3C80_1429230 [compost metagenome]